MRYRVLKKPDSLFPWNEGTEFAWSRETIISGGDGIIKKLWDVRELLQYGYIEVVTTNEQNLSTKNLLLG